MESIEMFEIAKEERRQQILKRLKELDKALGNQSGTENLNASKLDEIKKLEEELKEIDPVPGGTQKNSRDLE